jgi:aspartate/methionine/tyrosine aminotransferase
MSARHRTCAAGTVRPSKQVRGEVCSHESIIPTHVPRVNAIFDKAGVGVAPGVDFGQAGKRAVRFSYASSEENIREAARRLGVYLGRR